MSATPPSTLEGTQSPAPFELLWERYRSLILTIVGALLLALFANYAWRYYSQGKVDESWTAFATSIGYEGLYDEPGNAFASLQEQLKDIDLAQLEQGLDKATASQKPFLLLAIARKAMIDKNWDRAAAALDRIESDFPKHDLCKQSDQPVQIRDPRDLTREEFDELDPDESRYVEAKAGSIVGMMRDQIARGRAFALPDSFAAPEIPADARKVKFTMGDYGSFTVSLMPQAKEHAAKFLELAGMEDGGFWKGIAVDEITRPNDVRTEQSRSLHFGYATTKDDDRANWLTTEASEHEVEFENTGLSHFPGALAARPGSEGSSAIDRLWISIDDEANLDGTRVVFGYVTEGLDVLREICDTAGLSAQDEDNGRGRPVETIRVTAVEIL